MSSFFQGVPQVVWIRSYLYNVSGDYEAPGIDGPEMHINGNAQDQLGQIMKAGKLVVYGDVGQTFMYGAKGGEVYIMANAAGRALINAVGKPRVIINGTCLDYLAESFMAGNPVQGGGFFILNGLAWDDYGAYSPRRRPYPGRISSRWHPAARSTSATRSTARSRSSSTATTSCR